MSVVFCGEERRAMRPLDVSRENTKNDTKGQPSVTRSGTAGQRAQRNGWWKEAAHDLHVHTRVRRAPAKETGTRGCSSRPLGLLTARTSAMPVIGSCAAEKGRRRMPSLRNRWSDSPHLPAQPRSPRSHTRIVLYRRGRAATELHRMPSMTKATYLLMTQPPSTHL